MVILVLICLLIANSTLSIPVQETQNIEFNENVLEQRMARLFMDSKNDSSATRGSLLNLDSLNLDSNAILTVRMSVNIKLFVYK